MPRTAFIGIQTELTLFCTAGYFNWMSLGLVRFGWDEKLGIVLDGKLCILISKMLMS